MSEGGRTMRTWEEYKNHVKAVNKEERHQMEEIEEVADEVSFALKKNRDWRVVNGRWLKMQKFE